MISSLSIIPTIQNPEVASREFMMHLQIILSTPSNQVDNDRVTAMFIEFIFSGWKRRFCWKRQLDEKSRSRRMLSAVIGEKGEVGAMTY
jgi:hypothetical protein